MDRFQYTEKVYKIVGKCYCGEPVAEKDEAYQIDDYILCDDCNCFKKLCVEKLGAIYGKLNSQGNVE